MRMIKDKIVVLSVMAIMLSFMLSPVSTAHAMSGDSIVYVAETDNCYHSDGCSSLSNGKIPISLSEALSQGYNACSKCNPGGLDAETMEQPSEETTSYIGNKNTKKFHYPNCSSVGAMAEHNKYFYEGTREGIINQGYVPCKRCKP